MTEDECTLSQLRYSSTNNEQSQNLISSLKDEIEIYREIIQELTDCAGFGSCVLLGVDDEICQCCHNIIPELFNYCRKVSSILEQRRTKNDH